MEAEHEELVTLSPGRKRENGSRVLYILSSF